ncbi:GAL83 [Candida pseudojiufengensis]|uniref:GAL83 n=1 Tax=Candida pseudojiufengensis TaxID=497109 RepID=UPI002224C83C|nr:GAL83 [Candida pseudojiufengensis]KAI5961211.1 GAL83 [Candida pseudojiufengensis]
MVYQYTIKGPTGIKSVQITGTFDNWSKSLPEITKEPFEQTITLDTKEDLIFKFIIDGTWKTLDLYETTTDHEGNVNNVIKAEDLILVEEPINGDDEFVDNQTFTTTDNEDVLSAPVVINDDEVISSSKDDGKKQQQKTTPTTSSTKENANNTSAVSSFAAVSSPPSSSDYEHIDSKISNDTTTNKIDSKPKDTNDDPIVKDTTSNNEPKAGPKPDKPTLQAQASDSTLGINNNTPGGSQAQTSSSSTTTIKSGKNSQQTHKIPGSFDQSKTTKERPGNERSDSGLISKLKKLFK